MIRMTQWFTRSAVMPLLVGYAVPAFGQHQGHTMPGAQPTAAIPAAQISACVQAQQQASTIADQTAQRIESARQTNSPADMRAALDDAEASLARMKTVLQPCASLQAGDPGGQPHAGHGRETMQPSAAQAPAPMMSPESTSPATDAMSPPAQGSQMDHAAMGHAKPAIPQPEEATDPVCGMKVDPAKAPKVTYTGTDYYFCSVRDRDEFVKNPQQYLKRRR